MRKYISIFITAAVIFGGINASTILAEQQEEQNLYALYTFNERYTGPCRELIEDRSGNGHAAELKGSARYEADADRKSKVLYTDGSNQSYMEFLLPTDENGKVLEAFTVSMDMKNTTSGNYFNFYVGDGSTAVTGANYFGFKMGTDILLSSRDSLAEKKETFSGSGVQNEWCHIDFVLDNGAGSIYVNGMLAGTLRGYRMAELNASVGRLSFSAWSADLFAECRYDNVAVYSAALTAEEIADLPIVSDTEDNYDEIEPGDRFRITAERDADINDGMFGLFFEDINYAADGGLYAEMIENRSFEALKYVKGSQTEYDGTYSWSVYPSEGSGASLVISDSGGIDEENNNHYAVFTAAEKKGLKNNAYDGVLMEQGKTYTVSFYAKSDSYTGGIDISVYKDGKTAAHTTVTDSVSGEWTKYSAVLTADRTARQADFVVELDSPGTVSLDMISCIPDDAVFGIFRRDLAEKLREINPGFLRFPGGCIIEGYNLANRYSWKDSLGDAAHRKQNWNRWASHTNNGLDGGYKHYNQTYGLGFYEYFELCEYLGCKAVPVVNVGMACQYQSGETVDIDSAEFEEYIQDALDLIEFANGAPSTAYGSVRAEMGHPQPFNLEILGVGNEQWQTGSNDWFTRYERFEAAIHEKYPDMKLVATSGPGVQDDSYYTAWSWIREKSENSSGFAYVVDEHYYRTPDWFYSNMNFYDNYPRDVKVFAGEYASRRRNWSNDPAANTWETALSEAAYLTMVERNADVVYMASYAPLFARINYTQWSPDMIWFDDANCYGTPTYYVQKLYSNNLGDYTLKSSLAAYGAETGIYANASYDIESGDIIIKLANSTDAETSVPIELEGFAVNGTAELQRIQADPAAWNTMADPEKISPETETITDFAKSYTYNAPAYSFTVIRIGTTDRKVTAVPEEPQILTTPEPVKDQYQVMVYTTGTDSATGSIHTAVSSDGGASFTALNYGHGVVFAETENGSAKALRTPSVFKMENGVYGIAAVRTDPSQDEAADNDGRDGYFALYTTRDFISYTNEGFCCIGTKRLKNIACDNNNGIYTISWTDEKGIRQCVRTSDFDSFTEPELSSRGYVPVEGIENAVSASVIGITEEMYNALCSEGMKEYNIYNVDNHHVNGIIVPGTYKTIFNASEIDGSYNDYDIAKDTAGILPGWSSDWNASGSAQNQMNCNFITVNGMQYFQFYGPVNQAPVTLSTPGLAEDADWFAVDFVLNASTTTGCHDSILLDNDGKPFFGYAYAKNTDGFWPGDGERHYDDEGNARAEEGGSLSAFLAEIGGDRCTYTNGSTVMRIIIDNGAVYEGRDAYAVTAAYSDDGENFQVISTRYYSGTVNGFGGIRADNILSGTHWYDNTRYGDMKVYSGIKNEEERTVKISEASYDNGIISCAIENTGDISYVLYAAEYDGNGALADVALLPCSGSGTKELPYTKKADMNTIKLFLWTSEQKPLAAFEAIK